MAGVDPWGPYQLPEMVAMAKARNDAQFAHACALIGLLGNALSSSPRPPETFKPYKDLDEAPERRPRDGGNRRCR